MKRGSVIRIIICVSSVSPNSQQLIFSVRKTITCFHNIEVLTYNNIMGASSIDISQYRSRIGTFSGKKSPCSNKASLENKFQSKLNQKLYPRNSQF